MLGETGFRTSHFPRSYRDEVGRAEAGPSDWDDTASDTSFTDSLISSTFGCTSRMRSCSTLESFSIRFVTSCNSFSIISCLDDNRCIHQKQMPQQAVPIQARRSYSYVVPGELIL